MSDLGSYRIKSGSVNAADASSATAVVATVSGAKLSLRSIVLSNSATAAVNIKVQDSAATPNVFAQVYLAVNSTWSSPVFAPGAFVTAANGQTIDILASTANAVSAAAEAYVL